VAEHGISVPLPPPSVLDAPIRIEGGLEGEDEAPEGTRVFARELVGEAEAEAPLDASSQAFAIEGLRLDLTNNCIELWARTPEGASTEPTLVSVSLDEDEDRVVTTPGC